MKTYEGALRFRYILNGIFFLIGWSVLGWKVFSSLIIVDEETGEEKVSIAYHLQERQAKQMNSMNIIEYMTGRELTPRRPPVEITKTEFPADEFS
ncbi:hypothetical protein niasHT_024311 [Heterodera trifolii]|uniref:Uncharacterized protein n=1 Tax=Heterodera trifolii TaxID=157864 RepID=A0ABD2JM83_9BILA